MELMLKRLLNVATFLVTLFLLLLSWMMVSNSVANWGVFTQQILLPIFIVYFSIIIINYISFGKLTLWHKKTGKAATK